MKIETKHAGVYRITCITSNKIYIGSAMNLRSRLQRHLRELSTHKHSSRHLQNAFDLYGVESFIVDILEEYESIIRNKLLEREQYYLDALKPWDKEIGYNTCRKARSPEQLILSEGHKQKISEGLKGRIVSEEARKKIGDGNRGKKMSAEAIEKIRQAKTGLKQSEENVAKRAKSYSFIKNGVVYQGTNLKRFADEHNCHRLNLNKVLQGKRKSHHGFQKY